MKKEKTVVTEIVLTRSKELHNYHGNMCCCFLLLYDHIHHPYISLEHPDKREMQQTESMQQRQYNICTKFHVH